MSRLIYLYDNKSYATEGALRDAIFNTEGLVFGELESELEWQQVGVTLQYTDDLPVDTSVLAQQVRNERDYRLFKTDYYVMPDYPATEEMLIQVTDYRQQLRDITKQSGFPQNIVWPVNPLSDEAKNAK